MIITNFVKKLFSRTKTINKMYNFKVKTDTVKDVGKLLEIKVNKWIVCTLYNVADGNHKENKKSNGGYSNNHRIVSVYLSRNIFENRCADKYGDYKIYKVV